MLAIVSAIAVAPFRVSADEQRDFPTAEPGLSVSYFSTGSEHASACMANITLGLPVLAISFQLFSNGLVNVLVATQRALPQINANAPATLRVNSVYVFSKVVSASRSGRFYNVVISPIDDHTDSITNAIHEIATRPSIVSAIADDAQMPSIALPSEPELVTSLSACFDYMKQHR